MNSQGQITMTFNKHFLLIKERLESYGLYQVLHILGEPKLLRVIQRSMKYRSIMGNSLIMQIESLAQEYAVATETDLALLEVKTRMLKTELAALRRSMELYEKRVDRSPK